MAQKGGGKNYIESEIETIKKNIEVNNKELYKAKIIIEDFRKKLHSGNVNTDTYSLVDESEEKPKKVVKKSNNGKPKK